MNIKNLLIVIVFVLGLGIYIYYFGLKIAMVRIAPAGCSYHEVQCIMAPCDPVLFCGEQTNIVTTPTTAQPQVSEPLILKKAREDLANKLNIPAVQIITQFIEETNWSDSSLGCPEAGRMYTQAIVPGYKAVFENNAKMYEYHTSMTSSFATCTSK